MLMGGALVMTVLVLARLQVQPVRRCSATPREQSGKGDAFLEPGLRYGEEVAGDAPQTFYNKMDLLSLGIALVLGTAGLPHILIRFYTVPTAQGGPQERALGDRHHRHLLPDHPRARLRRGGAGRQQGDHRAGQGRQHGRAAARARRSACEFFGGDIGGAVMLAVIAAVAFATILAVVAGLTLASSSVARARLLRQRHQAGPGVASGRRSSSPGSPRSSSARSRSCWRSSRRASTWRSWWRWRSRWRRRATCRRSCTACSGSGSTPPGAVWAIYGGLISAVVLVFFSPVVSGAPTAMFPDSDWHVVPAVQPGHHLDPARLPLRLARHGALEGARRARSTPSSRSAR